MLSRAENTWDSCLLRDSGMLLVSQTCPKSQPPSPLSALQFLAGDLVGKAVI